jgi:FkbM family methyltransferase
MFNLMIRTLDNPGVFLADCLGLAHGDLVYRLRKRSISVHARAGTPDFYEVLIVLGKREYDLTLVTLRDAHHPVILDVGAHIGTFALLALDHYRGASPTLVAVEPALDNYEYLERNLQANVPLTSDATIHTLQAALGASDGRGLLDRTLPSDSYRLDTQSDRDPRGMQECDVVSTRSLCSQFGVDHVDVMKMDIEGGEYDVLQDAKTRAFIEASVDYVFIEAHDVGPDRNRERLARLLGSSFEVISAHDRVIVLRNRAVATNVFDRG